MITQQELYKIVSDAKMPFAHSNLIMAILAKDVIAPSIMLVCNREDIISFWINAVKNCKESLGPLRMNRLLRMRNRLAKQGDLTSQQNKRLMCIIFGKLENIL